MLKFCKGWFSIVAMLLMIDVGNFIPSECTLAGNKAFGDVPCETVVMFSRSGALGVPCLKESKPSEISSKLTISNQLTILELLIPSIKEAVAHSGKRRSYRPFIAITASVSK